MNVQPQITIFIIIFQFNNNNRFHSNFNLVFTCSKTMKYSGLAGKGFRLFTFSKKYFVKKYKVVSTEKNLLFWIIPKSGKLITPTTPKIIFFCTDTGSIYRLFHSSARVIIWLYTINYF